MTDAINNCFITDPQDLKYISDVVKQVLDNRHHLADIKDVQRALKEVSLEQNREVQINLVFEENKLAGFNFSFKNDTRKTTPTIAFKQQKINVESEKGNVIPYIQTTTTIDIAATESKSQLTISYPSPSEIILTPGLQVEGEHIIDLDKVCGVLTMADIVPAWANAREQIAWMWKILSENHIRDTEVWVEVSPANRYLTEDNLHRQAKQTKVARERAFLKGSGRDVGAEIKQEESFDAQKKLYKGAVPLNCAVVFLVYRENTASLDLACDLLCNSFGTAKVVRERNIANLIWLETLPITWRRILHSSSILSERRLVLESETVAGVLPVTLPKELDSTGVEFLTNRGGKPVYIDLFTHTQHALITGKTGSGKSVLLWRFMLDALSQGIPVVGMDIPAADGESSFKTAIALLGDGGAYFDLSRASNNLMEPPDLRRFDAEERASRMKSWRSFIRNALGVIVMGRLDAPYLAQRVDGILLRSLDIFLSDPDIIERYNLAFSKGWKSSEWQDMPTLKDFTRFCSIARLNIQKPEAIDHQAINQITSQIAALLVSPLGNAIAKPSSFSPEPMVKFYALTGLSNDQDSYTMAVAAKAACLRVALSYPKSLFIGDELSAAQELNAANTRDRQTQIATGNSAISQASLLTMPGGAVLGQPNQ